MFTTGFIIQTSFSAFAFTIGEEKEVGEKLLYGVRSAFTVLDDPDISRYINDLGAEVLQVAGVQYFDYRFYIIENRDFNAFAAPAGLIFFHSGLIETMNSEDELVSVLAHEIGHVVKRHLATRMENGKLVTMASMAVALAALALGDAKATAALITGSLAAGQSANLHFGRQHEEEADLLAYGWMKELSRSAEGQEKMLQTMRRITRYKMGQVPQYLLTHPDPEARLDYVQSLIAADNDHSTKNPDTDNFDFLRFKYRILSQVEDTKHVRQLVSSKAASPNSSSFDTIMAKYGLSQIDKEENNFTNSLKLLNEVIEYFPDENILFIDKGNSEIGAGHYEQAIKTLERAYKKDPTDNYATYSLADAYFKIGNTKKAKQLFKQIAQSLPEYSKVYYELGRMANAQNRIGESAFYLGKYNLYEGKLKLALFNFKSARNSKDLSESVQKEIEILEGTIKRIMKK